MPLRAGWPFAIASSFRPRSKPGRCHGSQPISPPKTSFVSRSESFEAAIAITASGCMWSTCAFGMKACSGVSIEAARGLRSKVQCGRYPTISSSWSRPR